MPIEDFALAGQIRSVQSFSWPLTPPRDSPVTCVVVLRAKKDRATKTLAVPGLFFEDRVDPVCARKMTFFRNRLVAQSKYQGSKIKILASVKITIRIQPRGLKNLVHET